MEDNVSCRILLVPSSKELGRSLIKRIIDENDAPTIQDKDSPGDDRAKEDSQSKDETRVSNDDQEYIPWTISNKYYTADVHFHIADWNTLASSLKPGMPAIVVVWEKGEDYNVILGRYALEWERLHPEVLLAVATGSRDIDNEKVENFCSEVGFEFIDADADIDAEVRSDDTGIPRVREALQTIMWPSMQLKAKPKRESYTRGHRSQGSIDRATRDGITTAMEAAIPVSITSVDTGPSKEPDYSLEKEKQKLQAWLDSDDDPWPKRPTEPGKVPDDGSSNSNPNPARATFDDDFTEFVSAPVNPNVEVNTNPHKEHVSDDDEDEDKFHFEDEDSGYKELFDDGMPTNEEILLTSQRIFGPALAESGKKGEPGELDDAGELDEDDLGEFDLGSIMGALQNMKDEIAAMTDEDAKRRAAATVALGLVWGLEGGRR